MITSSTNCSLFQIYTPAYFLAVLPGGTAFIDQKEEASAQDSTLDGAQDSVQVNELKIAVLEY